MVGGYLLTHTLTHIQNRAKYTIVEFSILLDYLQRDLEEQQQREQVMAMFDFFRT